MGNTGKTAGLRVLYGEGEAEVLAQQAVAVRNAGHQVETAVGRKAVQEALNKAKAGSGSFDLVILGPTLTRDDRHHLPYMVKKANQATRVLVLHSDGARHPYVDVSLDTGRSIEEGLTKVSGVAAKSATAGK